MFQLLITSITILATGAHAILGCCWHHNHACQHTPCKAATESSQEGVEVAHRCACHHAEAAEPCNEETDQTSSATLDPHQPCGQPHKNESGDCDEGHCQSLVNAKVEIPSSSGHGFSLWLDLTHTNLNALLADRTSGLQRPHLPASLLSGSLCVRDLTQIARI